MAGLKIMLAIILATIAVVFFFPMFGDLLSGYPDRWLGLGLWLVLFAVAALACGWAFPSHPKAGDA